MGGMEIVSIALKLLCGVAMFLYGMSLMGDSLKKVAGNKLEQTLYKLTNTPIKGVLLGAGVTAVIQSSSATSVMVVGFVNSGMMKLAQAIGIIMGANIGTSITGWILCLSYIEGTGGVSALLSTATISAVVAVIGIIFKMFVKKDLYKNIGDIMLGFAILMVGMQNMSGAMDPLKSSESFRRILTMFSDNPFLGILVGIVFTAILQSASASIGILQAISFAGGLTFAAAFPIMMGIGIGAACPVLLSSIGSSRDGKRTALVYLTIDLFGMIFWSVVFYTANFFVGGFDFLEMEMVPFSIAIFNTIFRMSNVTLLFPHIKRIEKMVSFIIKDDEEEKADQADFELLEERFLLYPPLAIDQSHMAMNGMARKARKNILRAMSLLAAEYTDEKYNKIMDKENLIDKYEDKLSTYLMQLTGREMLPAQTRQVSKFLHTLSDFERLGDHAVGIAIVAKELHESKLHFSEEATYELDAAMSATREIIELTVLAFTDDDLHVAARVEPLRELISILCGEIKSRHIVRLQEGKCDAELGFALNELLTNLDRIAAHCSNVAVAIIEVEELSLDSHQYVKSMRDRKNGEYAAIFDQYAQKYDINSFKEWKKRMKAERMAQEEAKLREQIEQERLEKSDKKPDKKTDKKSEKKSDKSEQLEKLLKKEKKLKEKADKLKGKKD